MTDPIGQIFGQDSVDTGQSGMQNAGQGINPSFQPLLGDLPEDLHNKVIPHLQQWDKGVTERFQKLQSDYEPWKSIISSGATPEMYQNGINILNVLERDPELLYKALVDNYGFGQQQQQQQQQAQQLPDQGPQQEPDPYDNRFQQMEQNFGTLAQHVLNMKQQEAEAAADVAVAKEFADAHKTVGDFDEDWVRAHCIVDPNLSVLDAAKQYNEWQRGLLARYGARPLITGSAGNGGVPGSNGSDPTKWSGAETRANVAAIIRQARAAANNNF